LLTNEKILVTGATGQVAAPLCAALSSGNEVWATARFGDEEARQRLDALGVTTVRCDLGAGDLAEVPRDCTVVLHFGAFLGNVAGATFDEALRINAEGTGFLIEHCRRAKSVLVASTASVYRPNPSIDHLYSETDPIGEVRLPHSPTYSLSKIAQESVARYCARAYDVPVVIARLNSVYGSNGGLPAYHLDWMIQHQPIPVRSDPCYYSPIHEDDLAAQLGAIIDLASTPATVVNWAGDEVVSPQQWCPLMGDLAGVEPRFELEPVEGAQISTAQDITLRRAHTGPCSVDWRTGMSRLWRERYPRGNEPQRHSSGRGADLLTLTKHDHAKERS
jgi:nucleoside-diphosphate-sugar epimerase